MIEVKYRITQLTVQHLRSGRVRHATKKEKAACEIAINKMRQKKRGM